MALLEAQGVGMVYRLGEVETVVLRDVDLAVEANEFVVIVGPSGSGKSTLLNVVGGVDRPTSGRVRFADHELSGATDAELTAYRREHVGFVFQFYNLVPTLTAIENVSVVTELVENPLDPEAALEQVGLSDRATHFPAQLSGGEQQRVAIARALTKDPDLLLCDEPTGALDLETGRKILRILRDVGAETGKSVILVTHNTAIAEMADRVVRIGSGRIESDERNASPAPPEEIVW